MDTSTTKSIDGMNVSLEDAIRYVMSDLPQPVRDFITSEKRTEVAQELSEKYQLRVDQAGEFERVYILMLLGILKPTEFVSSLKLVGLSQEVINNLATDVNTRVFIPLREAQQRVPQKPAPLAPPALDYQPAAATLPGSSVPAPMSTAPAPTQPRLSVPTPIEPTQAYAPSNNSMHPAAHQPPPVQGWHPAAAIHIYAPSHGAANQNPTVHYTQAPAVPQPEPSQEPAVDTLPTSSPVPLPIPEPTLLRQPAASSEQVPPPTPLKKDYAADPYREPIQ